MDSSSTSIHPSEVLRLVHALEDQIHMLLSNLTHLKTLVNNQIDSLEGSHARPATPEHIVYWDEKDDHDDSMEYLEYTRGKP